jgi:acetyl-CoA synthetase
MKTETIASGWDTKLRRRGAGDDTDDDQRRAEAFRWDAVYRELLEPPQASGFNLAALAVDRHASSSRANDVAIHWVGAKGAERKLSFRELRGESNRFANLLQGLGVRDGEIVFTLLGRIPELYVTALGTLKNRSLFCPLFSAFGPEPVKQRLVLAGARVLVTTESIYRRVVAPSRSELPELEHVLLVGNDADLDATKSYDRLIRESSDEFEIAKTNPEDPAILHFTSGTTGVPKGVVHVHEAGIAHYASARFALDLHPAAVFWCTADPGWVTGTSYGIFAPLLHGASNLVTEEEFDAERWYRTIQDHRVEIWYTSPTAIRMLMKIGAELPSRFDLSSLEVIASVGEPLNPEAISWGQQVLGLPILDNWWQTETGGIMIANRRNQEIRLGSMGRALPGIDARIVKRREDGGIDMIDQPNVEGEIALRSGWPSMMRGYLNQAERYRECFREDWYLSDDLARRDEDGFFWFLGRADDMIKTAGHRIGPFEIESVLMEHPAVAEAAAVGKPHPTAGEIVKAFVELKDGYDPGKKLERELLGLARKRLGSVSAPREIEICDELPKTRSGKIVRRVLRARERGDDGGDVSTLGKTTQ